MTDSSPSAAPPAPPVDADPRAHHYGVFYSLAEGPADDVAIVVGNCQAESLRQMLEGPGLATIRIPAVHELTASDLPYLRYWLSRAAVLVSQPVRTDYHGMPLGTAQLAALLPAGGRVLRVPVIRVAGLYPTHAIVRPPSDTSLVPPVVEYHDLRVLVEAAIRREGGAVPAAGVAARLDTRTVHTIADESLDQLRRREAANETVVLSDLFERPSFDQMRTLNHPGNPVWSAAATRVRAALGLSEHVVDPGRPLLDRVHAPREAAVIEAFGLDASPTDHWVVDGAPVSVDEVRAAHLAWYAEHPDAVDAGLARHAGALATLGLR